MYRSRSISLSCCLPKSGSTSVRASTWKARSQAAYQGYSHLSGIEMTSPLYMWCQWSLRGACLARRLERVGAALLEPLVHVVVVELLAPHHARQRLPHDVGLVGVERRRDDRRVELVGLLAPGLQRRRRMRLPNGLPACAVAAGEQRPGRRRESRSRIDSRLAGVDGQAVVGRDLGARLAPGSPRPSWPWTT